LPSATPGPCKPSTAARPSATATTPRPSPACCAAATSPSPTPTPRSGGACATCSALACVWSASAELYGPVHTARRQANRPPVSNAVKYKSKRAALTIDSADPFVRRRVETDLALLEPLDTAIRRLEAEIEEAAKQYYPTELAGLQSAPGVGPVLSLTILLEVDTIGRFETRQPFCSYARLGGAVHESDGKRAGLSNRRAGNAWLKWAFSEAAVLSAQKDERIGQYLDRLASRLGKPKALSAKADKLGRAFYHLLRTKEVVDVNRFVRH
jgi:transposase